MKSCFYRRKKETYLGRIWNFVKFRQKIILRNFYIISRNVGEISATGSRLKYNETPLLIWQKNQVVLHK
jgi:hypothetical protein